MNYSKFKKNTFYILLALFALGVFLRTVRIFLSSHINKDAILYIQMVKLWNSDGINSAYSLNSRIPPMFLYLMKSFHNISSLPVETCGFIISVFLGSLICFPAYFIARNIFRSDTEALIAAAFVVVHPHFVEMGSEIIRDATFLSFAAMSIMFYFIFFTGKNLIFCILAGIFAALATLARSEGVEILFLIILWTFIEFLRCFFSESKKKDIIRFLKNAFVGMLVFIICFFAAGLPVERIMEKKKNVSWTFLDKRMVGFVESFFRADEAAVIEKEDLK